MANTDSSTVAGNRAKNSPSTGLRVTIELPRSPWSRLPRKPRYCSTSGRSKPYWAIISAWRSGRHAALADHHQDRVARDQPDQDEGDEGDAQEGRDQDGEARAEEAQHVSARQPAGLAGRSTVDFPPAAAWVRAGPLSMPNRALILRSGHRQRLRQKAGPASMPPGPESDRKSCVDGWLSLSVGRSSRVALGCRTRRPACRRGRPRAARDQPRPASAVEGGDARLEAGSAARAGATAAGPRLRQRRRRGLGGPSLLQPAPGLGQRLGARLRSGM